MPAKKESPLRRFRHVLDVVLCFALLIVCEVCEFPENLRRMRYEGSWHQLPSYFFSLGLAYLLLLGLGVALLSWAGVAMTASISMLASVAGGVLVFLVAAVYALDAYERHRIRRYWQRQHVGFEDRSLTDPAGRATLS